MRHILAQPSDYDQVGVFGGRCGIITGKMAVLGGWIWEGVGVHNETHSFTSGVPQSQVLQVARLRAKVRYTLLG